MHSSLFNQKPSLAIYVTHGSLMVMKGIANACSKEALHLIVSAIENEGSYYYKIEKIAFLQENTELKIPSEKMSAEEFINFIATMCRQMNIDKHEIMLCADANLTKPSYKNVTAEFCYFVDQIKPSRLIPFSDTPECVIDANKYLQREPTNDNFRLPNYRLSGAASDRAHLRDTIKNEIATPTIIEVASPATDEVASPATDEVASPAIDEVASSAIDEVASPAIDEVASPTINEVASPAIDEGASSTIIAQNAQKSGCFGFFNISRLNPRKIYTETVVPRKKARTSPSEEAQEAPGDNSKANPSDTHEAPKGSMRK